MEKIMLPLGRRLKELRKERKLKQKEMARFLECTDRNYQKMAFTDIREKPDIIRKMVTDRHIHRLRLKRSMLSLCGDS